MNIGEAAKGSGVSTKMIRHYESIELIKQSQRGETGYRIFNSDDLHTLKFIKRARSLGFSLEQIRGLLKLWQDNLCISKVIRSLKNIDDEAKVSIDLATKKYAWNPQICNSMRTIFLELKRYLSFALTWLAKNHSPIREILH